MSGDLSGALSAIQLGLQLLVIPIWWHLYQLEVRIIDRLGKHEAEIAAIKARAEKDH